MNFDEFSYGTNPGARFHHSSIKCDGQGGPKNKIGVRSCRSASADTNLVTQRQTSEGNERNQGECAQFFAIFIIFWLFCD